jgi:hypothetical protein
MWAANVNVDPMDVMFELEKVGGSGLELVKFSSENLIRLSPDPTAAKAATKTKKHRSSLSSQYRGACWSKSKNKWLAQICCDGKR